MPASFETLIYDIMRSIVVWIPEAASFQASCGTLNTVDFLICFLPSKLKCYLNLNLKLSEDSVLQRVTKGRCKFWARQRVDPLTLSLRRYLPTSQL